MGVWRIFNINTSPICVRTVHNKPGSGLRVNRGQQEARSAANPSQHIHSCSTILHWAKLVPSCCHKLANCIHSCEMYWRGQRLWSMVKTPKFGAINHQTVKNWRSRSTGHMGVTLPCMTNAWQLPAQYPINRSSLLPQYVSSLLFHMRVVRQQLRGSHRCSKLFVIYNFLMWVVSFQITIPGNVESILYRQIFFVARSRKIKTRKFTISMVAVYTILNDCNASLSYTCILQ